MKFPLDQGRIETASSASRANLPVLIKELGKNAYDCGASEAHFRIQRDNRGRPTALQCRHNGPALTREALEAFFKDGTTPPRVGDREPLGTFGLGLLSLGLFSEGVEIHDTASDADPFRLAIDPIARIATIENVSRERLALRGPPFTIELPVLSANVSDGRADLALESLPLGEGFRVYLDDVEGRAEVRPRSYGGTLLDRGEMSFTWRLGSSTVSAQSAYELRMLEGRPRRRGRPAAHGIHLVRRGFVLDSTTFNVPVRRSRVAQLAGWMEVGDWLEIDPATTRPAGRGRPSRAFRAAARRLIVDLLAEIASPPYFLTPEYVAKLESELTQRFSKAVLAQPELAPIVDIDLPNAQHRRVLDISFRRPEDQPNEPLRSPTDGIRVRIDIDASSGQPPSAWDAEEMRITLNACHTSVLRMVESPAAFEVWAAMMIGQLITSMRPGRATVASALNEASQLLDVAYSPLSTPTSTRSQRERTRRLESLSRLKRQIGSRT